MDYYTERVHVNKSELYEDCRTTICDLPGVFNVRFSYDEKGGLSEIHILSDLSRSAKQIMRDVQSIMFARYNLVLDRRIVSIAQIRSEDNPSRQLRHARLICERVDFSLMQDHCACTVVLSSNDTDYSGSASSSNSFFGKQRIVAEATLIAVKKFLQDENAFSIIDVRQVAAGESKLEIVLVAANIEGRCEVLVGAAVDSQDQSLAVAKATLDAVNRRVQTRY